MFFLLRMAFWLTVILALLPVLITHENAQSSSSASKFSAGDAVNAATAAVSDLSQFCSRRPEACEAGMQAAAAVGVSAQNGVKILYDYIQNRAAADAEPALSRTGSIGARKTAEAKPAAKVSPAAGSQQDTLSASDLAAPWRSPATARNSGA